MHHARGKAIRREKNFYDCNFPEIKRSQIKNIFERSELFHNFFFVLVSHAATEKPTAHIESAKLRITSAIAVAA